jgi:hypothetical protein
MDADSRCLYNCLATLLKGCDLAVTPWKRGTNSNAGFEAVRNNALRLDDYEKTKIIHAHVNNSEVHFLIHSKLPLCDSFSTLINVDIHCVNYFNYLTTGIVGTHSTGSLF